MRHGDHGRDPGVSLVGYNNIIININRIESNRIQRINRSGSGDQTFSDVLLRHSQTPRRQSICIICNYVSYTRI